jgi:hypothetical protein
MSDKKWPSPHIPFWPVIIVNRIEDMLFSQNLLSLKVAEEDMGVQYSEATFNDWGTVGGSEDYLFSASDTFEVGKPFEVKAQTTALFTGFISGLTEIYSQSGPPLLKVEAKNIQRKVDPKIIQLELTEPHGPRGHNLKVVVRPRRSIWTLDLFVSAREWEVSLESNTDISKGLIGLKSTGLSSHVIAEFNAMLHVKDLVRLSGISSKFRGDYSVTRVTQLLDQQKGPRTEFTIERSI